MSRRKKPKVRMLCCGCCEKSYDKTNGDEHYNVVNRKAAYKLDTETWKLNTSLVDSTPRIGAQVLTYTDEGHYLWPSVIDTFHYVSGGDATGPDMKTKIHWKEVADFEQENQNDSDDYTQVNSLDDMNLGTSNRYIFVPVYSETPVAYKPLNTTSVLVGYTQQDPCATVYEDTTIPSLRNEYFNDTSPDNIAATTALINGRMGPNCCNQPCFQGTTASSCGDGTQIAWLAWLIWKKGYEEHTPPARDACFNGTEFCSWTVLPEMFYYGLEVALNNTNDGRLPVYVQVPEDIPDSSTYGYLIDITGGATITNQSWSHARTVRIGRRTRYYTAVVNDTRNTNWLNGYVSIPNANGIVDDIDNCNLEELTTLPDPTSNCQGPTCGAVPSLDALWIDKVNEFNDISRITIEVDGQIFPYIGSFNNNTSPISGGMFAIHEYFIEDASIDGTAISSDGDFLYLRDYNPNTEIVGTSGSYNIIRSVPNLSMSLAIEVESSFSGSDIMNPDGSNDLPSDFGISHYEISYMQYLKSHQQEDNYIPIVGPQERSLTDIYVHREAPSIPLGSSFCSTDEKSLSIRPSSNDSTEIINGWSDSIVLLYCPHNRKVVHCDGLDSLMSIEEGTECDDLVITAPGLKEIRVGDIPTYKILTQGYKSIDLADYRDVLNADKKDFTNVIIVQEVTVGLDTTFLQSEIYYISSSVRDTVPVPSVADVPESAQQFYNFIRTYVNSFTPTYICECTGLGKDSEDTFLTFDYLYKQDAPFILHHNTLTFKGIPHTDCNDSTLWVEEVRGFRVDEIWLDDTYDISISATDKFHIHYGSSVKQLRTTDNTTWTSTGNIITLPHESSAIFLDTVINFTFEVSFTFTINNGGQGQLQIDSVYGHQFLNPEPDTLCNISLDGYVFNTTWPIYGVDIFGGYSVYYADAVITVYPVYQRTSSSFIFNKEDTIDV